MERDEGKREGRRIEELFLPQSCFELQCVFYIICMNDIILSLLPHCFLFCVLS